MIRDRRDPQSPGSYPADFFGFADAPIALKAGKAILSDNEDGKDK
jgi:hypothetical protein